LAVPNNEKAPLAGPTRPLGSPEIPQFHLPGGSKGVYAPRLYGAASIQFGDRKRRLEERKRVAFLVPLEPSTRTVDWEGAMPTIVMPDQLLKDAPAKGHYLPLSKYAMEVKSFTRWAKNFDRWLARTQKAQVTTKTEPPETVEIGPKRGGVSVESVAIVWEMS
jgi:hypothetical protein